MRFWSVAALAVILLGSVGDPRAGDRPVISIPVNDEFDVLRVRVRRPNYRRAYAQAGRMMGDWTIDFAGTGVDGVDLRRLAEKAPGEPFVRVLREGLRRPVDLHDFLLLLDDLLLAGKRGLWGKRVFVLPGRARGIGALVHPDDVFWKSRPRRYPHKKKRLNIDPPRRHPDMEPAADGDLLGPNWVMRYKNPYSREAKLRALAVENPSGTFAARVESLIDQFEDKGCEVGLYTTVRNRWRGYLMWGAFVLSRKKNRKQVIRTVYELQRLNHEWGLDVPIRWYHPGGWKATREVARQMADAYDVIYATRTGARESRHYDAEAVDVTAVGLPRELTLVAPDGAERTFDLSAPHQTRDLNLTPELIGWIEKHFQMQKLESDYPHWNDTAEPDPELQAKAAAVATRLSEPEPAARPEPLPEVPQERVATRDWTKLVFAALLPVCGLLGILLVLRRRARRRNG